jgi:hypothetical protein
VQKMFPVAPGLLIVAVLSGCAGMQEPTASQAAICGPDWGQIRMGMPEDRLFCAVGRSDLPAPRPRYSSTNATGTYVVWQAGDWLESITTRNGRVVSWREATGVGGRGRYR